MTTEPRPRVALVTGGGGGLGAVYAEELARADCVVHIVDISRQAAEATVARLDAEGLNVMAHVGDLRDDLQVARVVGEVRDANGGIDILVNNAGGEIPFEQGDIELVDLEHWAKTIDLNLLTALLCCKHVAPLMKEARFGRIVNVSSRAARGPSWFGGVSAAYVCAKAAILALTRHLATELAPYGITVNCIAPSFVISGPTGQAEWDAMTDLERQRMVDANPMGRLPLPQEMAAAVTFLASDASSFVNGVALDVNGGSLMT